MKYKPALIAIAFLATLLSANAATAASTFSSSPLVSIQATSAKDGSKAKKPKKAKKAKTKKGGGVTFNDGSAESRPERDRRLMRECKGRPNAGACEGYTRP